MSRTIINEPITVEEIRNAIRSADATDAMCQMWGKGARISAENYTNIIIAQSTMTDDAGNETTEGFGECDCPEDIKNALLFYCTCMSENLLPDLWMDSFYNLLHPYREAPTC